MKVIKELAAMIRDELDGAEHYAKCAVKWKEEDSRLGDMFYNLARAELDHANMEHEQAVRLIKAEEGAPTEAMLAVWNWEHELLLERTAKIKVLLDMYKP